MKRHGRTKGGSEVVEHNGVLYFGGIVAEDWTLDMAGQTLQITQQLDRLLAKYSSSKEALLSVLVFITDMKKKPEMNRIWFDWCPESALPARATLGITSIEEGVLLEVVATAAVQKV